MGAKELIKLYREADTTLSGQDDDQPCSTKKQVLFELRQMAIRTATAALGDELAGLTSAVELKEKDRPKAASWSVDEARRFHAITSRVMEMEALLQQATGLGKKVLQVDS